MRITCPTCDAAYDVPDARIAAGRAVRCARCGSDWVPLAYAAPPPQSLPVPDPVLPAAPAPSPPVPSVSAAAMAARAVPVPPPTVAAPQSRPAPARARNPVSPILLAWAASLALLGVLMWAGIAWRASIMHAWPPSERLYAALGLLRGPPAR